MRNLLLFVLAFSFSSFTSTAVSAQIDTVNLKKLTQEFVDAFVGQDFQKQATMTHPNMIKMSGSLDFVRSDYQADYMVLKNMGFNFKSGTVGTPGEIFQSGAEYLCFVPQIFTVELNGVTYLSEITVLATSMTKGKVWNFVTLDRQDQKSITTYLKLQSYFPISNKQCFNKSIEALISFL